MKKLVALLFVAILVGSVTIPNVFSDNGQDDQHDDKNTNIQENNNEQNDNENNTNVQENDNKHSQNDNRESDNYDKTKMQFGYSNETSINITLPNGTRMTFSFSDGTNPGQQISSFVHRVHDILKQQESLSKQTIKDCREKARESSPYDRKNILDQCKASLKQINQQFYSAHKQLQLDFKQFREMVLSNNENHVKSTTFKNDAKIQHTIQAFAKQHGHEQGSKQHGKNQQKHARQG